MRYVLPIIMTVMLSAAGCAGQTGAAAPKPAAESSATGNGGQTTAETFTAGNRGQTTTVDPEDESPVVAGDTASAPSSSGQTDEQPSPADVNSDTDELSLLRDCCALKAELDALDIDMGRLEMDYLAKKMDENTWKAQKLELEQKEDALKLQKDRLKLDLKSGARSPQLPDGTAEELLSRLRKLESDEEELDLKEHMLEADYRSGAITREDFISQQTELLILDEQNDWEKDLVEDALEIMGIDD